MTQETLKKVCCPFDHQTLSLAFIRKENQGRILEGLLHCTTCKRLYPIIHSIPIMSPDAYREFDLERPILERWSKELGLNAKQVPGLESFAEKD